MGFFERFRALGDAQGLAAVLITHHVNLASRFADRVLLLSEESVAASGSPAQVLTRDTVGHLFAWPVAIQSCDRRPQMIPLRAHPSSESP
jgi:iron complex transport system ATP-binding protein